MEMELKNIIEKIKAEGVEEADKQASTITEEAEKKAKKIIEDAEAKKTKLLKEAKKESEKLKANGEEALRQASRDVLLVLRERIVELFNKITEKEVGNELSPDVLAQMIVKAVEDLRKTGDVNVEVLLSEKDKDNVEKKVFSTLKKEAAEGLTLKVSPRVEKGFLIGEKDAQLYYDVTDGALWVRAFLYRPLLEFLPASQRPWKHLLPRPFHF